jgi:hypothetical protein
VSGLAVCAAVLLASHPAAAEERARFLPTVTVPPGGSPCPPEGTLPDEQGSRAAALARELDAVLVGAAQDLDLSVEVSGRPPRDPSHPRAEADLVEQAAASWVFAPEISVSGSRLTIRIVAVSPGSSVLLVRSLETKPDDIDRAVLIVRDLLAAGKGGASAREEETPKNGSARPVERARSKGRAIFALNAAVLGGYVGYSLQRAGGSADARLTYPLMALGTGVGLGGSMIVADEWDVGIGDAWYLTAGTWWPAIGALLVADSHGTADSRRFAYGAGAAAGGIAAATVSLAFGEMSEGGALIAHSGGAFGTGLGAVAQMAIEGHTTPTPTRGMGIGAISGVLVAGTLARLAPPQTETRVLLVDVSAGLGGLTGAALASPLVFGEDVGTTENRLWLSAIALGTFAGAGVGLFLFPSSTPDDGGAAALRATPFVGSVAATPLPDGTSVPAHGIGVRGVF